MFPNNSHDKDLCVHSQNPRKSLLPISMASKNCFHQAEKCILEATHVCVVSQTSALDLNGLHLLPQNRVAYSSWVHNLVNLALCDLQHWLECSSRVITIAIRQLSWFPQQYPWFSWVEHAGWIASDCLSASPGHVPFEVEHCHPRRDF